jgi:hypothetical protein
MNGVAERGFCTDRERASAMLQEVTNSVLLTISKILGTRLKPSRNEIQIQIQIQTKSDQINSTQIKSNLSRITNCAVQ